MMPCPQPQLLHIRYAPSEAKPWVGNGPVQVASSSREVERRHHRGIGATRVQWACWATYWGSRSDGDDAMVDGLKQDIANAKGKMALLETGDWGAASDARVAMKSERFGPEPPSSLVELVDVSSREIYAACGFNAALWGGSSASVTGSMAAGPIQCLVTPRADGRVRTEGQT